jgi:hypothetical protein
MKFKRFLKEESRIIDAEIFINPSNKEISFCWKEDKAEAVRFWADFENKILFVFKSMLLHSTAIKEIIKHYKKSGFFYRGEAWLGRDKKIHVVVNHGDGYYMENGVGGWRYDQPPLYPDDIKWIKERFDFLNKMINEEYVGSFNANFHSRNFKGGYTEVFVNPSKKELKQIVDQSHTKSIRCYVDLPAKKLYCWKAETVHYLVDDFLVEHGIVFDWQNTIRATVIYENGKLRFAHKGDHLYDNMYFNNKKNLDLSWLSQWFDKTEISQLGQYK